MELFCYKLLLDKQVEDQEDEIERIEKEIAELKSEKEKREDQKTRLMKLSQDAEAIIEFRRRIGREKNLFIKLETGLHNLENIDISTINNLELYDAVRIENETNTEEAINSYVSEMRKIKKCIEDNNEFYTGIYIISQENGLYIKCNKFINLIEQIWLNRSSFTSAKIDFEQVLSTISKYDVYDDVITVESWIHAFNFDSQEEVGYQNTIQSRQVHLNQFVDGLGEEDIDTSYNECDGNEETPIENLIEAQKESKQRWQFLEFTCENKEYWDAYRNKEEQKTNIKRK